jgi:acetolactate synthase I/III small subunit
MHGENYTDHTISVLVNHHPGVLSKLTSLITRRGFNIDSISAGPAKDPDMYRLTIIVKGDDRSIEQIQKQLYKIVDTVKVSPIDPKNKVEREIGLIKLRASNGERQEILQMVNVFKGQILDSGPGGFVVEIVGSNEKVNSFISLFPPQQIIEVARTGIVAMNRWEKNRPVKSQRLLRNK